MHKLQLPLWLIACSSDWEVANEQPHSTSLNTFRPSHRASSESLKRTCERGWNVLGGDKPWLHIWLVECTLVRDFWSGVPNAFTEYFKLKYNQFEHFHNKNVITLITLCGHFLPFLLLYENPTTLWFLAMQWRSNWSKGIQVPAIPRDSSQRRLWLFTAYRSPQLSARTQEGSTAQWLWH